MDCAFIIISHKAMGTFGPEMRRWKSDSQAHISDPSIQKLTRDEKSHHDPRYKTTREEKLAEDSEHSPSRELLGQEHLGWGTEP